jgi:hypothetical protein
VLSAGVVEAVVVDEVDVVLVVVVVLSAGLSPPQASSVRATSEGSRVDDHNIDRDGVGSERERRATATGTNGSEKRVE